jgi:transposase-like protein
MSGGARSTHDGLSGHIVGVHIKEQVGIFAEEIVTTDTLGRRTGPRMRHTIEEKLRIVEETRARGASVATVARRHNVNPNQVFAWRQLYRRGLLHPQAAKGDAKMLPVKVSTPTVLPSERATPTAASQSSSEPKQASRLIEIKLSNGHSIVLHGRVNSEALSRVIDLLVQR